VGKSLFTKNFQNVIIACNMNGHKEGRAVRTISEIVDYLPIRSGLDSDQMTTPHELGIDDAPIVIFDPHVRADLARIVGHIGSQDLSELVANCVNLAAKLTDDAVEGASVRLDLEAVKGALSGEEGEATSLL
jgi:hypothetical protein